jgi:hypothetical protein
MLFRILGIIAIFGSLVFIVWYMVLGGGQVSVKNTDLDQSITTETTSHKSGSFLSKTGNFVTDFPLLDSSKTKEISEGFFESTNSDLFGVFYLPETGNLTVTLYGEDTKRARLEAEAYLKKELQYSESDLCSIAAEVVTNEYENPRWSGMSLGFSFCPDSVEL